LKITHQHNVFIADISNEGILGMDFLAANNCDVMVTVIFMQSVMEIALLVKKFSPTNWSNLSGV
jgi:hypothetical protein